MKKLRRYDEEGFGTKQWVVMTMSESGDYYLYFIEHPVQPTSEELQRFLMEHGNDVDDNQVYEYVKLIKEITTFQKIKN